MLRYQEVWALRPFFRLKSLISTIRLFLALFSHHALISFGLLHVWPPLPSEFLRLPLIWVEKCSTCGAPLKYSNISVIVTSGFMLPQSFFTIMDLPCDCFPAWCSPCCCHPEEFCNKTRAISSWCCSLDLGWKILNNKKGSLTLAQLIYESCWALCNPSHPPLWFLKRPPALCMLHWAHWP